MGVRIIDLDEVLGEDKHVKLQGREYRLPPDIPVELWLWINKAAADGLDLSVENIDRLRSELLELFRYGDPDLETLPLTLAQTVVALGMIYGEQPDEDGEDAERPTRQTRGGSSKTSRSTTRPRS